MKNLPIGKLPPDLLEQMLGMVAVGDPRLILGPGIGLDCAVVESGKDLLVFKTDPITFAMDEIGWYAVQICANDIVTTGAEPRWFMPVLLLPEDHTSRELVLYITRQVQKACAMLGAVVIGGHTEITSGLDRPILCGTMVGEVPADRLVTPRGLQVGDSILLTKGVPLEAVSILARQFPERLRNALNANEIAEAAGYLYNPGISVVREAQLASQAGQVNAMHDPTEGGLAGALWELAEAGGKRLVVDTALVNIPDLAKRACAAMRIDPLAAIASGALLISTPEPEKISTTLVDDGIPCRQIGRVETGRPEVWRLTTTGLEMLPRPRRDEIARLFEGILK